MEIQLFRSIIDELLTPLIDRDYVFLDLPYHGNIGDAFIYQGAMDFLSSTGHKCLYKCSEHTYDSRTIDRESMIIFNGGGNFGDIWPDCTEFRNRIISRYPNHKYLILPQSVHYHKEENLERDKSIYARCTNMTICARDQKSFDILSKHFCVNRILLAPDMAFHLPQHLLGPQKSGVKKRLFIRRNDRETAQTIFEGRIPKDTQIQDWPTINCDAGWAYVLWRYYRKLVSISNRIGGKKSALHLTDFYWQKVLIPYNIQTGLHLVRAYDTIYTTRLHAALAGLLLGKEVIAFDNVYGKLSAYADTWLDGLASLRVVK